MSKLHSFKSKTFFSPTYCQYCSKLLWGLIQQGVQCIECNYVSHHYCQKNVPAECQTTSHPIPKTLAEKSLLNNLQQVYSESRPSTSTTTSSSKSDKINMNNALKELQEIIISAALDVSSNSKESSSLLSNQCSSEYLSSQPPLHPHTTAKNFTRFVSRCTVVFDLRDAIILLVCWDKPLNSWISILIYTLLCLYPKLLLLVPQCILLYLVLFKPPKQRQQVNTLAQNGTNSKDNSDVTIDKTNNQEYSIMNTKDNNLNKKNTTTNQQQQQTQSAPSKTTASTTSTFLSLLTNTNNNNNNTATPAYKNNLKNIQNMMGEFALVHDQFIHFYNEYYNLFSQEVCIQIILLLILFTIILLWFIPLHWIFLSSGWFTFAIHTRFVKAFWAHLTKTKKHLLLLDIIQDWTIIPFQAWYNNNIELYEQSTTKHLTVSIYENQQRKVKNENNETIEMFKKDTIIPWSNLYGIPQPSPNEERDPPKGYCWKCDDWRIDTTGPWVDDDLQIVLIRISSDKIMFHRAVRPKIEKIQQNEQGEGWIYMDENWNNLKSESYQQSTIRRRRWIRNCELKK